MSLDEDTSLPQQQLEFDLLSPNSACGEEQNAVADKVLTEGWHHLTINFESVALTLYVDGAIAASEESYPRTNANNRLGQSQFEDNGFFADLMDEFCIYSRALSAGKIRYLRMIG